MPAELVMAQQGACHSLQPDLPQLVARWSAACPVRVFDAQRGFSLQEPGRQVRAQCLRPSRV